MQKTTHREVLVSADLAVGLGTVVQNALETGQLRGKERKFAVLYLDLLEKAIKRHEERAQVRLSVNVVANILRIILMIIKPDPLVKAVVFFFERLI